MTASDDERFMAELANQRDLVKRLENAIAVRDAEDAEYAQDFSGEVPTVPKGMFDEYEWGAGRFEQEFQYLTMQLHDREALAPHEHAARERITLSAAEKRGHAFELKGAKDTLKAMEAEGRKRGLI